MKCACQNPELTLRDQHCEEVAQLIVHVGGIADGLGDLRFYGFAETLAQAVDRDLHRAFARAELPGGVGLGKERCFRR